MPCDAPGPTSLNILAADQFTRISEILTMDDDRIISESFVIRVLNQFTCYYK